MTALDTGLAAPGQFTQAAERPARQRRAAVVAVHVTSNWCFRFW